MKIIVSLILVLFVSSSWAAAPTCHNNAGSYCRYTGKVSSIYVNSGNLILMYFDTPVDIAEAAAVGFNITQNNAAAYRISENPDFAKLFYSTALAAQATGRDIYIQMHSTEGSYLKFDRIWLSEP